MLMVDFFFAPRLKKKKWYIYRKETQFATGEHSNQPVHSLANMKLPVKKTDPINRKNCLYHIQNLLHLIMECIGPQEAPSWQTRGKPGAALQTPSSIIDKLTDWSFVTICLRRRGASGIRIRTFNHKIDYVAQV